MFKRRAWKNRKSPATVKKQISRALNARERTAAQWRPLIVNPCNEGGFGPRNVCPNQGRYTLWEPRFEQTSGASGQDLEGKLLQRIVGDLYFRPMFEQGQIADPVARILEFSKMDVLMRVGLMKQRAQVDTSGAEAFLEWNPLEAEHSGLDEGDWTQGRWMRLWEHMWGSNTSVSLTRFPPVCCGNVHSAGQINSIASGTGTITIPAISTDCNICGESEDNLWSVTTFGAGPFVNLETKIPSWWKLHIDVKQRLRMENTDRLDLFLGWESMSRVGDTQRPVQPTMEVFGNVKGLWGSGA